MEILGTNGQFEQKKISFSRLAFFKHMAMAGQGFMPSIQKYTRMVGVFFHYIEYFLPHALSNSHLSEPPPVRQDPTEKGQVSNVVGKAIGDLLARRISGARFTLSYESAMVTNGHKIRGRRPDLYCIGSGIQFAVEAKGYEAASVSIQDMLLHKDQSRTGPLPVNFTVASVAYNLYNLMKAKYHDPLNENISFNEKLNSTLLRIHYQGLFDYVRTETLPVEDGEIHGRQCFFIRIMGPGTPYPVLFSDKKFVLCLILDKLYSKFSEPTLNIDIPKYSDTYIETELEFLDTDGVGIGWRHFNGNHVTINTKPSYKEKYPRFCFLSRER